MSSRYKPQGIVVALALVHAATGISGRALADETGDYADGDDQQRAAHAAAEGLSAQGRGDYESAIAHYMESLQAIPSADLTYTIARIYDSKLSEPALAISYYQQFLADPRSDPRRVRMAYERIRALREAAPAREADEEPEEAPVADLAPAASVEHVAATAGPALTEREKRTSARRLSSARVAGIVIGSLGLGGLAAGAALGFKAKSELDESNSLCEAGTCVSQRGKDAGDHARTFATASTAAVAAGGGLALLGGALLIWGGHRGAEVTATADAGRAYVGARIRGSW